MGLAALMMPVLAASAALAQSSEAVNGLAAASKLAREGEHAKALDQIGAVLRRSDVDGDVAAKAMLMRGEAHEQLGRPAHAFADYEAALWLQGLSASERKRAVDGRQRTLGVLRLAGDAPAASAPGGEQARPERAGGGSSSWQTSVQEDAGGEGGIAGFFSELFGGSAAQERDGVTTQAPPPRSAERTATAAAGTETRTASTGGGYNLQLATVGSEDGAASEAKRLGSRYRELLGGRTPEVRPSQGRDGKTLYRVVVGPFESKAQPDAMCASLKSGGASCLVVSSR